MKYIKNNSFLKKIKLIFIYAVLADLLFIGSILAHNRANNWVFNGYTLSFSSDTVNVKTNALSEYSSIGYTSISDSLGNLLFYTNSFKVWSKNDSLMLNGDSLLIPGYQGSRVQESLIIPKPGSSNIFYIFTVDPFNGNDSSGLYYSIIDMSLNEGLGKVTEKRKKLVGLTTNKITACYHQNHRDVWIITHKFNTNSYYAFCLNENGVDNNPVISKVGLTNNSSFDGQLKCSPDGRKVVITSENRNFNLFDFNNANGELSNSMNFEMPITYRGCEGAEFSSDATKLFVIQFGSTGEHGLYQFDLTLNDSTAIKNSMVALIYPFFNSFVNMQLAPDGKIYITKGGGGGGTQHFGTIKFPNERGANCIVSENGLYLNGGESFVVSTPNFIQNYFFKTSFTYSGLCFKDSTVFSITNVSRLDSVLWLFGDSSLSKELNPKHIFKKPSKYLVKLITYYPEKFDTIQKEIVINDFPKINLGSDTTICYGYKLKLEQKYETYLWNDNSNKYFLVPKNSGKYWAKVTDKNGCFGYDTLNLTVNSLPRFNLGNDTVLCENMPIKLSPKSKLVNCTFLWNSEIKDSVIIINKSGVYWLTAKNLNSCSYTDSIQINKKIPVNLGNDTTILPNSSIYLNAGYHSFDAKYSWDDFSTNMNRYIPGNSLSLGIHTFHVNVRVNDCVCSDIIKVNVSFDTKINSMNDESNFSIFPNPFDSYVYLKSDYPNQFLVKVFSNSGEELLSQIFTTKSNQINLSSYPKGIYYISIIGNDHTIKTIKIIKK